MTNLVDSHAHLDLCAEPLAAIDDAQKQGVKRIVAVGIDLESSRRAVAYAYEHSSIVAAVGVHPHDAAGFSEESAAELARLAREQRVVAIGETGLDFYRQRSEKAEQIAAFIRQIELARESGLTLIVHSREAGEETLEVLEKHAGGLTVIIHCFSLYEQVEACAERGYFMSLAGNVTFKKAVELREAAAKIPPELLLTETDSPYLAPVPYRGKPNQPGYVRHVLEEVASLRNIPTDHLADQIFQNFQRAFNIQVQG